MNGEIKRPVGESNNKPKEGDTKVVDGVTYRFQKSPYTLRQYYSHDTKEMGPGPGWDFRNFLLSEKYALEHFGRTFTVDEVFNPDKLPDLPMYEWVEVAEDLGMDRKD